MDIILYGLGVFQQETRLLSMLYHGKGIRFLTIGIFCGFIILALDYHVTIIELQFLSHRKHIVSATTVS